MHLYLLIYAFVLVCPCPADRPHFAVLARVYVLRHKRPRISKPPLHLGRIAKHRLCHLPFQVGKRFKPYQVLPLPVSLCFHGNKLSFKCRIHRAQNLLIIQKKSACLHFLLHIAVFVLGASLDSLRLHSDIEYSGRHDRLSIAYFSVLPQGEQI